MPFAAVVTRPDGKIYSLGGSNNNVRPNQLSTFELFDPTTGQTAHCHRCSGSRQDDHRNLCDLGGGKLIGPEHRTVHLEHVQIQKDESGVQPSMTASASMPFAAERTSGAGTGQNLRQRSRIICSSSMTRTSARFGIRFPVRDGGASRVTNEVSALEFAPEPRTWLFDRPPMHAVQTAISTREPTPRRFMMWRTWP